MTKTEARRLARIARSRYGHYQISATLDEYICPLDVARDHAAHRIGVPHQPWETVTAASIDAAVVNHYTSPDDDERCPRLASERRR